MRRLSVPVGAGLRVAAFVAAVLVVTLAVGANSSPRTATADGSQPTPIGDDGIMTGVYDILVHATNDTGHFNCMAKLDHEAATDEVQAHMQCYVDIPEFVQNPQVPPAWAEVVCTTVCPNPDLQNPSEPHPTDGLRHPPPPPPYNLRALDMGAGQYYPSFVEDCYPAAAEGEPCMVLTACFEDAGYFGPSVIAKIQLGDPEDQGVSIFPPNDIADDGQARAYSSVYYWQSNSSCKNRAPKGMASLFEYSTTFYYILDENGSPDTPSPWRVANFNGSSDPMHDYDGDGCSDTDELDPAYTPPPSGLRCGDDPFNPYDSFDPATVDLTGVYRVLSRMLQADCADPQDCIATREPGIYTSCLAELRHNTTNDNLTMRPYCYPDTPLTEINPPAYPGATGDGRAGAPPPGPDVGGGSYAYGPVGANHAELSGSFDPGTSTIDVEGCFIDAFTPFGVVDVWFVIDVSAHQRPGDAAIYLDQDDDCANSPSGDPVPSDITFAKQEKGLARDDDQDGVPTSRELGDDTACGLRDPFNKNDYYDVSIPRDGKIELFADILLVIGNFNAVGYAPGALPLAGPGTMENYDRPPVMAGSLHAHSRGTPDGKIELFVDILGVIGQANAPGCAPLP